MSIALLQFTLVTNMKNIIRILLSASLLLSSVVFASDIKIENASARATAPGQEVGSAGMVITSKKDAKLIAVSTPASETAEIHTMTMEDGVMKMRQLEYLALPANQPVTLGPGGDHLMFMGLKKPLKAGKTVPLTLTIQYSDNKTEKVKVKAQIKAMTGMQH